MIHLNEELKKTHLSWLDHFLYAEFYVCQSISDLENNINYLKPTKKVLPPAMFFNGCSVIKFANAIGIEKDFVKGGKFPSIDENGNYGTIFDLTGSLTAGFNTLSKNKLNNLLENLNEKSIRLYDSRFTYNKEKSLFELTSYKETGPSVGDRSKNPSYFLNPALSLR